ncbi:GGDEF domain-containing protein [Aminipila terrae]|uniref:Diguanylate cyclase n=1 Tax=Aminipila terrae TaxID=2697030 RepID=A0A6P1MHN7_9FIRM|nr:GGDEF domain-containing protein [Aminipila terrae]QHI71518.1 diguanylate cyclase [Aminipila terrae]
MNTGYVHENSKDSFCQLFYKIQGSESIVSGVFQIRLADSKVEYEDYIWMRITLTKVFDENSVPIRVLGVSEDITEEMSFKEKATKDSLTNLLNRAAFRQYTMQYLAEHMDDESGAMFLIDIDNFKHVNDQHGHVSGDELLLNIANILTSHFRSEDLICRLGGDEFTVFMKHVHDIEEVRKKAKLLSEALIFNSDKLFSTCSIGIVMKKVNSTYEDLYWYADRAMYQAKQQGKNQWYLIP